MRTKINSLISKITKEKPNIADMICAYTDKGGCVNWKCTEDMTIEQAVYILEQVKFSILTQSEEE